MFQHKLSFQMDQGFGSAPTITNLGTDMQVTEEDPEDAYSQEVTKQSEKENVRKEAEEATAAGTSHGGNTGVDTVNQEEQEELLGTANITVAVKGEDSPQASNNTTSSSSPKVLYTVFAGRKNRLMLQEPYWAEMHKLGAINEVHLWNFIHNGKYAQENRAYLRHLQNKYSFLTIMEPSDVEMPETLWYDKNHSLTHLYRALWQWTSTILLAR